MILELEEGEKIYVIDKTGASYYNIPKLKKYTVKKTEGNRIQTLEGKKEINLENPEVEVYLDFRKAIEEYTKTIQKISEDFDREHNINMVKLISWQD